MKTVRDRLIEEFRFLLWYPRKWERRIKKAVKKSKQTKTQWISDCIQEKLNRMGIK